MPPVSRIPAQALLDALKGGNYPFWFPEEAKGLGVDYFVYGTDFEPLAISATASRSIQINADSAFMILSAVMVETATDNTTFMANRPLLVSLSTGGAGLSLSNTPIHANNWFGTAQEPKYWDVPKVLLPNSTLQVTIQNLEATARNIRVAFHGFKLFKYAR